MVSVEILAKADEVLVTLPNYASKTAGGPEFFNGTYTVWKAPREAFAKSLESFSFQSSGWKAQLRQAVQNAVSETGQPALQNATLENARTSTGSSNIVTKCP